MVSYPESFPADAVQVVFSVASNGFAPDGEHGDVACFAQACWNIQGYGLSLWKPHKHPDLKAYLGGIENFGKVLPAPENLEAAVKDLAGCFLEEAEPGAIKAAIDWKKIPWDKVLALVSILIQSLLLDQK